MTRPERSRRDLFIEHKFIFGHNGPPRGHSPHAQTAPPEATFAAEAAAKPTVTCCAPAVPKTTAARAATEHWRRHSCRDSSSGVRYAPWDAAWQAHERAGEAARVERACAHLPLQLSAMAVRVSTTRARSGPSSRRSGLHTSAHASELRSRPQTYSERTSARISKLHMVQ